MMLFTVSFYRFSFSRYLDLTKLQVSSDILALFSNSDALYTHVKSMKSSYVFLHVCSTLKCLMNDMKKSQRRSYFQTWLKLNDNKNNQYLFIVLNCQYSCFKYGVEMTLFCQKIPSHIKLKSILLTQMYGILIF